MKFPKIRHCAFVAGIVFAFIAIFSLSYPIEAAPTRDITPAQAEQIALENLGAGEVIQNRIGRYQGVQVHQIRIDYTGERFRVFVDMHGNIIRGNVDITIPEAINIAMEQTGDANVSTIRFTKFDGADAYNITTENFRVIIDSATGEVLRIRAN